MRVDDLYVQRVAKAAAQNAGEPLYNSSLEHAKIVVERLFQSAEKTICIFAGTLNPRVYGSSFALSAAAEFLGLHDAKMRIIVENPNQIDLSEHPLINSVLGSDDVAIRALEDDMRAKCTYHFSVVDSKSYRFEIDKHKTKALVSFGDPEIAGQLQTAFDLLWDKSGEIELRNSSIARTEFTPT